MAKPYTLSLESFQSTVAAAVKAAKSKHTQFAGLKEDGLVVDPIRITGIVFERESLQTSPSLEEAQQLAEELAAHIEKDASQFRATDGRPAAKTIPAAYIYDKRILLGFAPDTEIVALTK
jgi:hypothetical protein